MDTDESKQTARLDRATPAEAVQQRHLSWFADHAATSIARDLPELSDRITSDSAKSGDRVDLGVLERYGIGLRSAVLTKMDFSVTDGCRVVGTPYDLEWQVGGGNAFVDYLVPARDNGKFGLVSSEGFSAAGVGFYLSSPTAADVTVTPQGNYDFRWILGSEDPFVAPSTPDLFSQGGLGITVYVNEDKSPVLSRRVALWDNRGHIYTGSVTRVNGKVVFLWSGDNQQGSIASAAAPPTPGMFGPTPLAPILLRLTPGNRYLIWVWCWEVFRRPADPGAFYIVFFNARMPAVTVCAGTPIVGPR